VTKALLRRINDFFAYLACFIHPDKLSQNTEQSIKYSQTVNFSTKALLTALAQLLPAAALFAKGCACISALSQLCKRKLTRDKTG
jgi:hypothetical protein